jgi:1-acyl-sn-glycerol-3-phosphate acyltransferase
MPKQQKNTKTPVKAPTVRTPAAPTDAELRDPTSAGRLISVMRTVAKRWFRSQVFDLDKVPEGGALLVSNHSGGMITMDVPVFASAVFDTLGAERAFYVLAHDILFAGPVAGPLKRAGIIPATRFNAHDALTHGGLVMVFPGGDYDVYRPTTSANTIDFRGRKGYIRTALQANVPIVPLVSIGGQENQLYLSRGRWLAKRIGMDKLIRTDILPITFGFPFGLSVLLPVNLPLPTKIVSRVLDPIDVRAQFGSDPDIAAVDHHVRAVMQDALDELARRRRFPIIG